MNADLRSKLDRIQRFALVVGVLGAAAMAYGFVANRQDFYRSYLYAYFAVLGMGLGSLILTMIHYLTGGFWGLAIRRQLQAGIRTLPLLALLFVPIAIAAWTNPGHAAAAVDAHGAHDAHAAGNFWLYPWTDEALVASDHLLQHKAPWLNKEFWLGRAILCFVIWIGLGWWLLSNETKWDKDGDVRAEKRTHLISGPGVLIFALVTTMAIFDWAMSADPKWFSTMYGVIYMVGQALAVMAFAVIFTAWVKSYEPFHSFAKQNLFHDLGTLMFAFIMLWAYTSFSQFLIIWSGNIGEETPFYLIRTQTSWQVVAGALLVFHFAVPFFLLLMRRIKRDAKLVPFVALLIIVMRLVDLYWQIIPIFHAELHPRWMDFVAPFALGGLWLAYFMSRFKAYPVTSPRHEEALQHAIVHAHH